MLTIKFASLSHLISVAKMRPGPFNAIESVLEQHSRSCVAFIDYFVLPPEQQDQYAKELLKIAEVMRTHKQIEKEPEGDSKKRKKDTPGAKLFKRWLENVKKSAAKCRVQGVIMSFLQKAVGKTVTFEDFKQKCPKHFEMFETCRFVTFFYYLQY